MEIELWTFREPGFADQDVVGFSVEASDGSFGKVDEASYDAGVGYLVIDTTSFKNLGFGKHALVPAAAVTRIDHENRTVVLSLTQQQIKDAPEFSGFDDAYREQIAGYYGPFLMAPGMVAPSTTAPIDRR